MNIELYNRLCKARQDLRNRSNKTVKPLICHDEQLVDIAELKPRTKNELLFINGLGQAFVEKYGDYFINVIYDYYASLTSHEAINNDIKDTLKNYEKRLTNINKKNRLLYSSRLYNNTAYDLYDANDQNFNQALLNLIYNRISSVQLCNTNSQEGIDKYKRLSTLIREVESTYREKGDYDLYIAYPYVEGYFMDDDFFVRAPLVLFPATINRTPYSITLSIDYNKDILYNNVLVLLYNKYHNTYGELPTNVLDDVDTDFIYKVIEHYYEVGIKIELDKNNQNLSQYIEYSKNNLPKYSNEKFKLINNIILGRFSLFSSAIQKDYKTLINSTNLPALLFNLLSDGKKAPKIANVEEISEKDIYYINDLDGSQEKAIYQMNHLDSLVIEGPPGTGKSQTITSLIIDGVSKQKTILMVSEKKAALEVIQSRLGDISKYAMLISDVNDKNYFYEKLLSLMDNESNKIDFDKDKMDSLINEIDLNISDLSKIKTALYDQKINNVPAIEIFQENIDNSIKENNCFNDYINLIDDELLNYDYDDLKCAKEMFSKAAIYTSCLNVEIAKNKYPWLDFIRDISYEEYNILLRMVSEFYQSHNRYLKMGVIGKILTVGKERNKYKHLYNFCFTTNNYYKYLYHNFDELKVSINKLNNYRNDLLNYNKLSDCQKLYLKNIYKLREANLNISNDLLFDIIISNSIEKFSYENRDVIKTIKEYPEIVSKVIDLINDKKKLTYDMVTCELHKNYVNLIEESKRFSDIKRAVESKRKSSISRFINRFRFELFKGIRIWLMTPETVSELLPLTENLFDILIFDEASQIYIEKSLPVIYRADKVIISGDTKQLNPSSLGFGKFDDKIDDNVYSDNYDSDYYNNANLEEKSLLDLAKYRYSEILLNYHYRSKYEELINFSNAAYYNSRLNISPNVIKPTVPPIEVIKIDNGTFIKRKNKEEALKAIELLKSILKNRKNNETLGIITFNSSQKDLIEDMLDDQFIENNEFSNLYKAELNRTDNGEDTGLFIKNIENVQGDERDIIIFVIGYAKGENGTVSTNFGWLNQLGGENRLNVAVSRAKQKIYVITSITPNELNVEDSKNTGPKLFKKYLEYAYAISNKDNVGAKLLLDNISHNNNLSNNISSTIFENDVYNYLIENIDLNKFAIEREVGNSNYKISLGIKEKATSRYILGIICDNYIGSDFISTKERDIYRYKYLVSRGWKIIQVWSINWCKSPIDEANKIMEIINQIEKEKKI